MDTLLFSRLFNNNILRKSLFKFVKIINNHINRSSNKKKLKVYKWKKLLEKPLQLAAYSYVNHFKDYFERNPPFIPHEGRTKLDFNTFISRLLVIGQLECIEYFFNLIQIKNYLNNDKQSYGLTLDLLCYASSSGRIKVVNYIESLDFELMYENATLKAAGKSDQQLFFYLMNKLGVNKKESLAFKNKLIIRSVKSSIERFEWILLNLNSRNKPILLDKTIWYKAVKYGNIDFLNYLLEKHPESINEPVNEDDYSYSGIFTLLEMAANSGQFEALKWIHSHIPNDHEASHFYSPQFVHNMEMFYWVAEHYGELLVSEQLMNDACKYFNLEMVKILFERFLIPMTEEAFINSMGNLEFFKIIHRGYESINQDGSVSLTELVQDGICTDIFSHAFSKYGIEVLDYIYTNNIGNCRELKQVYVKDQDHLDKLIWVTENTTINLNISSSQLYSALSYHDTELFRWCYDHMGNIEKSQLSLPLEYIIELGDVVLTRYVLENMSGKYQVVSKKNILITAIKATKKSPLEIFENIKYLLESRVEFRNHVDQDVLNAAVDSSQLNITKYIHSQFNIPITLETIRVSLFKNRSDMIEWVLNTMNIPWNEIIKLQLECRDLILDRPYLILSNYINNNK